MLKTNIHLFWKSLILLVLLVVSCGFVFYMPYKVVRDSTIDSLNAQQLVLAKQASQGVKAFFQHYEKMLVYLAQQGNIIHLNDEGKNLLENLYRINKDELSAVTRVSAVGRITHTVPYNPSVIGKDISEQDHNRFIINRHEPIVSDVFTAVQGYRTVAYAIPVFDGESYAGCLSILIPFEVISKKYIAGIVLGDNGYAWMLSKQGVELYCPVPGHTGKTVYETSSRFPTVIKMSKKMLLGEQGVTTYSYDRIKNEQTETILKHAVYFPVDLPNNIWSIVVATPENQAISAIGGFGKWWLSIFAVLIICIVTYISFYVRSKLVTEEGLKRKHAEHKLKESERLFHQIISNAHIAIIMVNNDGEIELVNRKCEELYGYNKDDIPTTAEWFKKAYPNESLREKLAASWKIEMREAMTIKNVEAPSPLELPITCKDGSVKDVYFDFTLIEKRVIITLTDRTEQNSIDREKQRLLKREDQAKRIEVVGLMAGSVAHDLNNILSGIVSYPDLLLAQLPENSKFAPLLERIKESGTRAVTVVDDLLTAARGVAKNREFHNLNMLIEEYITSPEHERLKASHPDVSFIVKLDAEKPTIFCSPVHIKKSLMNLVTNGAEAIEGQGIVSITTEARIYDESLGHKFIVTPGKYVALQINDTGTGISDQDLEHIFEPFYTKKSMGRSGSGLGLMIVKNSVIDHHGQIFVKSSEKGTSFDLFFPISDELETDNTIDFEEEEPGGMGEHILIVDDESLLGELAYQILQPEGYTVNFVKSGEEAITYLKHNKADLVLLDMIMEPGLNGRQTYEEILQFQPQQKAIIVSGYSESEDVKKTMEQGSGGLLKKPYTRLELLKAVREELNRNGQVI